MYFPLITNYMSKFNSNNNSKKFIVYKISSSCINLFYKCFNINLNFMSNHTEIMEWYQSSFNFFWSEWNKCLKKKLRQQQVLYVRSFTEKKLFHYIYLFLYFQQLLTKFFSKIIKIFLIFYFFSLKYFFLHLSS